jgi:hypothetical protein
MTDTGSRVERLQIMLTEDELRVLDDWRFGLRMPSRAAADGFTRSDERMRSKDFGVTDDEAEAAE